MKWLLRILKRNKIARVLRKNKVLIAQIHELYHNNSKDFFAENFTPEERTAFKDIEVYHRLTNIVDPKDMQKEFNHLSQVIKDAEQILS